MMKSILTILTALFFSYGIVCAQTDHAFRVMVNKGSNEVKVAGSWQPIKTGLRLKANDEIKVGDNAYLGLVHESGKPLEVKSSGTYKVLDLAARMTGGKSVLNKYTDFILSSNTEKKNKLTATGAVHRGGESTKVFLPRSEQALLFGDYVVIDWEHEKGVQTYIVSLKSIFGDDLMTTEASGPVSVNLADEKFVQEDNIIVEVYPKGQPNKIPDPPFVIKKLSKGDKERIKGHYNEIAAIVSEESALTKLLLAGFYEENKLIIDAANAYHEAMKLAPDVEQFKQDYENFLKRHGMKQ